MYIPKYEHDEFHKQQKSFSLDNRALKNHSQRSTINSVSTSKYDGNEKYIPSDKFISESRFSHLPAETILEILYALPVPDVLTYCKAYNIANVCNNEEFWKDYVETRFGEKIITSPFKNTYRGYEKLKRRFEQLMINLLSRQIKSIPSILRLPFYLEYSKIVPRVFREQYGIPGDIENMLISEYDMLVHHVLKREVFQIVSMVAWIQLETHLLLPSKSAGVKLVPLANSQRLPVRNELELMKPFDQASLSDVFVLGMPILEIVKSLEYIYPENPVDLS
jgi:hypothetical protein